jgi:hypothetical protein
MTSIGPLYVIFSIDVPNEFSCASFPHVHCSAHTINKIDVVLKDYKPIRVQ